LLYNISELLKMVFYAVRGDKKIRFCRSSDYTVDPTQCPKLEVIYYLPLSSLKYIEIICYKGVYLKYLHMPF